MYSYINPLLVNASGILPKSVSFVMVLAGAGMCAGNMLGGKFSDKFSPAIVAAVTQLIACVSLLLMFFLRKTRLLQLY